MGYRCLPQVKDFCVGVYEWSSGEPLESSTHYSNWKNPSIGTRQFGYSDPSKDCVIMDTSDSNYWSEDDCNALHPYICMNGA